MKDTNSPAKFCQRIEELHKAGLRPMVQHHLGDRIGPVISAKPMGFGTKSVLIKTHNDLGGILVDPLTWDVLPNPIQ